MNRLLKAAAALVCAFGINSFAGAQLTTITAAHIDMGGVPISAGTVTFTPVNVQGTPIAFAQSGGGLNAPTAYSCTVTAGAITGSCQIPDSALTTPANILYAIQVTNTATTPHQSFTLQAVPGVTGTTWALDAYGPPAQTTNVQPVQLSYGTAAPPSPCIPPSIYIQNNSGGKLFMCVAGVPVLVTSAGGGATIASTANLIKGDGTGNGVSVATLTQCGPTAPQMTGIATTGNANCVVYIPQTIAGATADYDFLQGSGTSLTDISGNANTATLGASALAPTWTATGLVFTGQENVSLPSALNASQTFLVGVYLTPLAPGNSFGVYGSNTFPTIASSSLDLAGLNLMYTPGPNYVAADQGDLAPGILSGSGTVTNCINRLSGWHVLGYVLGTSGTSVDHIYIDGNECNYSGSQGTSAGKQTSGNIFLGSSGTTNYSHSGLEGTMYRFVAFSSALTPAQILTFTGKINAEVASRGVPLSQPAVPLASAQLTAIGDSITCGFQVGFACNHVTPWTGLLSLTNQPTYTINNWGIPGVYLSAILASDPNRIAQRCVSSNGPVNAVIFAGTNDLAAGTAGSTVAGVFGYLAAEIQVVKNAGCRVFVGTMISRTGTAAVGGTVDAAKDAYDALILTGAKAAGADGVIDFAADPLVGADNAYSNTTYFETAAVHPTLAGQQRLANAASNALNYYYGTSASAPHVVATTTYTMVSGDRFVQAAPTANAAYTMPDCTGPSGEVYTISNPQSAHTLTITGGASQPINGLSSAITIPSNSTVTLRDVANSKVASGCQWAM